MKITITHDFETLEEAEAFLDKLTGGRTVVSGSGAVEFHLPPQVVNAASLAPEPEKKPRKSKSQPKIDTSAKPVDPQPLPQPEAKIDPAELQTATDALFKAKGLTACVHLLARYGAAKVRELVPDQFAKYKAEAEELARAA